MRILTALTYYAPHVSGLTVGLQRVVRRLVQRGHHVTVLTSRFSPELPAREMIDGATVIRSPVLVRVSKGALMPRFLWDAARLIGSHDIVYLHLPQLEASGVALLAKVLRKPVVTVYHCDIELPSGAARAVFTPAIRLSHYIAGKLSDRIIVNTPEYGETARLPRRFHHKVLSVYPPAELAAGGDDGPTFRTHHSLGNSPLVGFVGRYAEEKGLDYLLEAVPLVLQELGDARFVFAGPTDTVPGERVHDRLQPTMAARGEAVVHVGLLTDAELAAFYRALDVLVLPSTNSTESFGLTQVEAMIAGTPVVASDLSGVHEAVRVTGMGLLVPPRDAGALARAIVAVLREPQRYVRPPDEIRRMFDPENTVTFYERLFSDLTGQAFHLPELTPEAREAASEAPAAESKPSRR